MSRYDSIYRAIVNREVCAPPPLFEGTVGEGVKGAWLGRPIRTLEDDIEFWDKAGYAFYPVVFGIELLLAETHMRIKKENTEHEQYSLYDKKETELSWSETGTGSIRSDEDFQKFPWPDPEKADYSILDKIHELLPDDMRVLANIGKVFTASWQLMGFTHFCEMLYDEPELVAKVIDRVAEIQKAIFNRVIKHPVVGAVLHADDVAYFTGPMISPAILEELVYPHYKEMGVACREADKIYLYHSDGNVMSLLQTIVDCGFHGLHPLETNAISGVDVQSRVGDRICLLGHVDVDLLARGTPEEVKEQTLNHMNNLCGNGGYCPGSANSVPDYVPVENYKAMVEAAREWRPK